MTVLEHYPHIRRPGEDKEGLELGNCIGVRFMDLDRPAALDYSIPMEDLEIHRYLSRILVCICEIFAAVDTGAIEIAGGLFSGRRGSL